MRIHGGGGGSFDGVRRERIRGMESVDMLTMGGAGHVRLDVEDEGEEEGGTGGSGGGDKGGSIVSQGRRAVSTGLAALSGSVLSASLDTSGGQDRTSNKTSTTAVGYNFTVLPEGLVDGLGDKGGGGGHGSDEVGGMTVCLLLSLLIPIYMHNNNLSLSRHIILLLTFYYTYIRVVGG